MGSYQALINVAKAALKSQPKPKTAVLQGKFPGHSAATSQSSFPKSPLEKSGSGKIGHETLPTKLPSYPIQFVAHETFSGLAKISKQLVDDVKSVDDDVSKQAKEAIRKERKRKQDAEKFEINQTVAKLGEQRNSAKIESANLADQIQAAQKTSAGQRTDFSPSVLKLKYKEQEIAAQDFDINLRTELLTQSLINSQRRVDILGLT